MHKNFDFVLLVFYPFARRPLVLPLYETCAHFVINVKREASAGENQELGWGWCVNSSTGSGNLFTGIEDRHLSTATARFG